MWWKLSWEIERLDRTYSSLAKFQFNLKDSNPSAETVRLTVTQSLGFKRNDSRHRPPNSSILPLLICGRPSLTVLLHAALMRLFASWDVAWVREFCLLQARGWSHVSGVGPMSSSQNLLFFVPELYHWQLIPSASKEFASSLAFHINPPADSQILFSNLEVAEDQEFRFQGCHAVAQISPLFSSL